MFDQAFLLVDEFDQVGEVLRGEGNAFDMDVDAARLIDPSTGGANGTDNVLKTLDVAVVERGSHELTGVAVKAPGKTAVTDDVPDPTLSVGHADAAVAVGVEDAARESGFDGTTDADFVEPDDFDFNTEPQTLECNRHLTYFLVLSLPDSISISNPRYIGNNYFRGSFGVRLDVRGTT
jgi:hypothetical protein